MATDFSIIVAHDENWGIGNDNTIPWKISEDMAHFRRITMNAEPGKQNIVIMGRLTYESLPTKFRPLPGRINIVVSRTLTQLDGSYISHSIAEALEKAKALQEEGAASDVYCIGGSQLYTEMIHHERCCRLYITQVNITVPCNAFFPKYTQQYQLHQASENITTADGTIIQFKEYKRTSVSK